MIWRQQNWRLEQRRAARIVLWILISPLIIFAVINVFLWIS